MRRVATRSKRKYCTGNSFQTGLYLNQKRFLPRCNGCETQKSSIQELTENRGRNCFQILEAVKANPGTTTRRLALQLGVTLTPCSMAHLKKQGLHPYHVQKVQNLRRPNSAVNYCRENV
jgi:hypothetical protein